jgi:hypothetical protein
MKHMTTPYGNNLSKFADQAELENYLTQPGPAALISTHDQLTGEIPLLLDQLHVALTRLKSCENTINALQPHESRAVMAACQNGEIRLATAHGRLVDVANAAGLKFTHWESEWMASFAVRE